MAVITLQTTGMKELHAKLRAMEAAARTTIMRDALTAGAAPIEAAAKTKAPVLTGKLRESIKTRIVKDKDNEFGMAALIGTSAKDFTGDTFYASFIEYGYKTGSRGAQISRTANRVARTLRQQSRAARDGKGGGLADIGTEFRQKQEAFFAREGLRAAMVEGPQKRTEVPAKPFMRPAFDENVTTSLQIIQSIVAKGILEASR